MLSATTGGCVMPREIFKWLDSLDLSFSVKNPRVDLANGYIVAEMLSRYYPKEVSIYTYYNNQAKDKRHNNWEQIQKEPPRWLFLPFLVTYVVLSRKQFKLDKEEYEAVANLAPDQALNLLFRLYEFLTKKKLNLANRTIVPEETPLYTKPTASHLAKDRELSRIVDNDKKYSLTKNIITNHLGKIKTQKYNSGLIQWLITKRKQQIQEEVERQQLEITRKTRTLAHSDVKGQIKEIQLKCFNSSTSKKAKGQQGDFMEAKGTVDFLVDSCMFVLRKDAILRDIKTLNLELKQKDTTETNILSEIFNRCDEKFNEEEYKVQPQTLCMLLQQFSQPSEVGLAVENIYNNFIDFKKYFSLFLKPLKIYKPDDQVFRLIVQLVELITGRLHQNDSQSTHILFRSLLLPSLVQIGNQHPQKRASISQIILALTRRNTVDQFETILKVKDLLGQDTKLYVSYLAHFITLILKANCELEESLWQEMFFYANAALTNPSPHTRANGCKIISQLIAFNENVFTDRLDRLKKLACDSWWEVRAQTLVILSRLLTAHRKGALEKSKVAEHVDDNLNFKTILNYILDIFHNGVTHNILRIGLIELAELLNYESELCDRYLDVLLNIGEEIRLDVLNTDAVKMGPVVFGCNTFSYRLTGAPLEWNPIGVARALDQNIRNSRIQFVSKEHLDILFSALSSSRSDEPDRTVWLTIYQNLKQYLFRALTDANLCLLTSQILKKIFEIPEIQVTVMRISKDDFKKFLSKTQIDVGNLNGSPTESNMLNLFEYFNSWGDDFREYTYQILKEFSEEEKDKYLQSNFIQFMNDLARKRRSKLFSDM